MQFFNNIPKIILILLHWNVCCNIKITLAKIANFSRNTIIDLDAYSNSRECFGQLPIVYKTDVSISI